VDTALAEQNTAINGPCNSCCDTTQFYSWQIHTLYVWQYRH